MSLKEAARKTLAILEVGGYETSDGAWVELGPQLRAAVAGSELVRPKQLAALLEREAEGASASPPTIEVTAETTQIAAHRLMIDEGVEALALLNFASARNPGGGFIRGAKAQEEDLARASALHACLLAEAAQPYYRINRVEKSTLYTDHMIWSPRVPFFRTNSKNLLDQPYFPSVITAPAPNAGPYLSRGGKRRKLSECLVRRAGMVLALARDKGQRNLLLGAWGCGVFQNHPPEVADAFGQWLEHPRFAGAFDRVVFAVYDRKGKTRAAFHSRFPREGLA